MSFCLTVFKMNPFTISRPYPLPFPPSSSMKSKERFAPFCKAKPLQYLVHNVQELQEDGSEAAGLVGSSLVGAMGEAVTKGQPLLLNQSLEALDGAVVGVQQHLCHTHHLCVQADKP